MNEYCQIDQAMEDGKFSRVRDLVLVNKVCPSLYAIQMSTINGHHGCVNFALTYCHNNLRSGVDIKTTHYNHKTDTWSREIPSEYRY
jgi:hypothetical protein